MKLFKEHMIREYNVELADDATVDDFVSEYIKAKQARVAIAYPQKMSFINVTINNLCNLSCYSCDQFVDSAPAKGTHQMSLDQIKDFVEESQKLQWKWDELRITGGEPSLHPDFLEILSTINEGLKQSYLPNLTLKIISNGTGKRVRRTLDIDNAKLMTFNRVTDGFYLDHIGHPDWLVVCSKPLKDTMKRTIIENYAEDGKGAQLIPEFGNVWQAPIDRLPEIKKMYEGQRGDIANPPIDGYYPPRTTLEQKTYIEENNIIMDCQVHASCGWELSKNGFSPCGCGGSRVIGNQEDYFGSLSEITLDECYKKLAKMCATCGQNMNYAVLCSKRTERTEFWNLVLKNYTLNKPELKPYDPFNRRGGQHEG